MKITSQECASITRYYDVVVLLNEDTNNEIEITATAISNETNGLTNETLSEITIINPEDLPDEVSEQDIESLIEKNF